MKKLCTYLTLFVLSLLLGGQYASAALYITGTVTGKTGDDAWGDSNAVEMTLADGKYSHHFDQGGEFKFSTANSNFWGSEVKTLSAGDNVTVVNGNFKTDGAGTIYVNSDQTSVWCELDGSGTKQTYTYYFRLNTSNNSEWTNLSVHYWDFGGVTNGDLPPESLGNNYYKFEIEASSEGNLIFHKKDDWNSCTTGDINNVKSGALYTITASKTVTETQNFDPSTIGGDNPPETQTYTFYLDTKGYANWGTPHVWLNGWSRTSGSEDVQGVAVENATNVYKFEIDNVTAVGSMIIFRTLNGWNGTGFEQTENVTTMKDGYLYTLTDKGSNGRRSATVSSSPYTEPQPVVAPQKLYFFNGSGSVEMTKVSDGVFRYEVNATSAFVYGAILDGSASNWTDAHSKTTYFPSSHSNDSGNYSVDRDMTWNSMTAHASGWNNMALQFQSSAKFTITMTWNETTGKFDGKVTMAVKYAKPAKLYFFKDLGGGDGTSIELENLAETPNVFTYVVDAKNAEVRGIFIDESKSTWKTAHSGANAYADPTCNNLKTINSSVTWDIVNMSSKGWDYLCYKFERGYYYTVILTFNGDYFTGEVIRTENQSETFVFYVENNNPAWEKVYITTWGFGGNTSVLPMENLGNGYWKSPEITSVTKGSIRFSNNENGYEPRTGDITGNDVVNGACYVIANNNSWTKVDNFDENNIPTDAPLYIWGGAVNDWDVKARMEKVPGEGNIYRYSTYAAGGFQIGELAEDGTKYGSRSKNATGYVPVLPYTTPADEIADEAYQARILDATYTRSLYISEAADIYFDLDKMTVWALTRPVEDVYIRIGSTLSKMFPAEGYNYYYWDITEASPAGVNFLMTISTTKPLDAQNVYTPATNALYDIPDERPLDGSNVKSGVAYVSGSGKYFHTPANGVGRILFDPENLFVWWDPVLPDEEEQKPYYIRGTFAGSEWQVARRMTQQPGGIYTFDMPAGGGEFLISDTKTFGKTISENPDDPNVENPSHWIVKNPNIFYMVDGSAEIPNSRPGEPNAYIDIEYNNAAGFNFIAEKDVRIYFVPSKKIVYTNDDALTIFVDIRHTYWTDVEMVPDDTWRFKNENGTVSGPSATNSTNCFAGELIDADVYRITIPNVDTRGGFYFRHHAEYEGESHRSVKLAASEFKEGNLYELSFVTKTENGEEVADKMQNLQVEHSGYTKLHPLTWDHYLFDVYLQGMLFGGWQGIGNDKFTYDDKNEPRKDEKRIRKMVRTTQPGIWKYQMTKAYDIDYVNKDVSEKYHFMFSTFPKDVLGEANDELGFWGKNEGWNSYHPTEGVATLTNDGTPIQFTQKATPGQNFIFDEVATIYVDMNHNLIWVEPDKDVVLTDKKATFYFWDKGGSVYTGGHYGWWNDYKFASDDKDNYRATLYLRKDGSTTQSINIKPTARTKETDSKGNETGYRYVFNVPVPEDFFVKKDGVVTDELDGFMWVEIKHYDSSKTQYYIQRPYLRNAVYTQQAGATSATDANYNEYGDLKDFGEPLVDVDPMLNRLKADVTIDPSKHLGGFKTDTPDTFTYPEVTQYSVVVNIDNEHYPFTMEGSIERDPSTTLDENRGQLVSNPKVTFTQNNQVQLTYQGEKKILKGNSGQATVRGINLDINYFEEPSYDEEGNVIEGKMDQMDNSLNVLVSYASPGMSFNKTYYYTFDENDPVFGYPGFAEEESGTADEPIQLVSSGDDKNAELIYLNGSGWWCTPDHPEKPLRPNSHANGTHYALDAIYTIKWDNSAYQGFRWDPDKLKTYRPGYISYRVIYDKEFDDIPNSEKDAYYGVPMTWDPDPENNPWITHEVYHNMSEAEQNGVYNVMHTSNNWHVESFEHGFLNLHLHHIAHKDVPKGTDPNDVPWKDADGNIFDETSSIGGRIEVYVVFPVATDVEMESTGNGGNRVRRRANGISTQAEEEEDPYVYNGSVGFNNVTGASETSILGNPVNRTLYRSFAFDSAVGTPTGVESVAVEDTNAPEEVYNLQGVRITSDNLAPGIYIFRQGNKTTKKYIR